MTKSTTDTQAQTRKEWSTGSYQPLAMAFLPLAARLVDAAGVEPGDRVLDVACGTGNVALTVHRRGAQVTGVDITPTMLEMAREQARVIDAEIDWREGDAADLAFPDDAFDVTLSCLGHMFVPDASATATELLRVTAPGGTVAFTAWMPTSAVAAMMQALSAYRPEQPDSPPPFLWGDPDTVRDRFGDGVVALDFETGVVRYPAISPAHFWESMTTDSGPIILALETVEEGDLPSLREDVLDALAPHFSEADNAVELEYRLVTARVQ